MFGNRDPGFRGEHDPFNSARRPKERLTTCQYALRVGILVPALTLAGIVLIDRGTDKLAAESAEQLEPKIDAFEASLGAKAETAVKDAGQDVGSSIEETIKQEFNITREELLVELGFSPEKDKPEKDCPIILVDCIEQ